MRKTIIAAATVALVSGGIAIAIGPAGAAGPGTAACPGHLYTYDGYGPTFTVPDVPVPGYHWEWAQVKAGSENQGLGHTAPFAVSVGQTLTHPSGKDISHVDLCKVENPPPSTTTSTTTEPPVTTTEAPTTTTEAPTTTTEPPAAPANCDTSAVVGGVAGWLASNGFDGGSCFDIEVAKECGVATGSVTNQPTPQYAAGPFRLVWNEGDGIADPYGPSNFPAEFPEDYNGGSVTISYYIVGPEKDWFSTNSGGVPNYWGGIYGTEVIDTDCEQPESPTTTEAPATTTEPPVTTAPPTTVTPTPSTDPAPTTTTVVGSAPAGGTPPPAPAPAPNMPEWMLSEASLPQTR